MFGIITRLKAHPGQGEALGAMLASSLANRPGCLSYIAAADRADPDIIWVTEVWTDEQAHQMSLQAPEVRAITTRGWAMVATIDDSHLTTPFPAPHPGPGGQ